MSQAGHQEWIKDTDNDTRGAMAKDHSSHEVDVPQHPADNTGDGGQDEEDPPSKFREVLAQLREEKITHLASSARRRHEEKSSPLDTTVPTVHCRISGPPLWGSYNLVYKIVFDDGVRWMVKIPATGHHRCHDSLAAHALRTEVETMRFIKDHIDIPLPAVYDYNQSMDNEIGCPYIAMEFIDGIPLWQAWFSDDVSTSKKESIRLKAMQTVAAAMVKLSRYTFGQSGALCADLDGVNIVHSRAVNYHAVWDRDQDHNDTSQDDIYLARKPCYSALSYLLSMLRRRGIKSSDRALDRGGQRSIDLLTKWACEHFKIDDDKFTLAHPDLDTQNVLVKEDGTLCGIIDWDGVAVVPIAIGALKYPLWLSRDWNPICYNYNPETQGPLRTNDRTENSPEELIRYRAAYAHSIETASLISGMTSERSKQNALTTRASLVIGSLELAASNPYMTRGIMRNIFNEMEDVAERLEFDDESDTDSASSEDSEHDDDDKDVSISINRGDEDEIDDEEDSDETRSTALERMDLRAGGASKDILYPRCLADERSKGPSISGTKPEFCFDPLKSQDNKSNVDDRSEPTSQQPVYSTRVAKPISIPRQSGKIKFAQLLCELGEKGCKGLASTLHQKEQRESSVEERSVKERDHSEPISIIADDSRCTSSNSRPMCTLLEAIQELLHDCYATLHRITDSETEVNHKLHKTAIQKDGPRKLLALVFKNLRATLWNLLGHRKCAPAVEDHEVLKTDITSERFLNDEELAKDAIQRDVSPESISHADATLTALSHVDGCLKAANIKHDEGEISGDEDLSDVWGRIHFEVVHNASIPVQMIKENQAWIADQIIEEMRRKSKLVKAHKEAEQHQKEQEARKIARENKKAGKEGEKAGAMRAAETARTSNFGGKVDEEQTSPYVAAAKQATGEVLPGLTGKSSSQMPNVTGANTGEGAEIVAAAATDSVTVDHPVADLAVNGPPEKSSQGSSQKETARGPVGSGETSQSPRSLLPTNSLRRIQENTLIPRGSPCPCGSRHKFKKCCGRSQDAEMSEIRETGPSLSPMLSANMAAPAGAQSSSQGVSLQIHDKDSDEYREDYNLESDEDTEANGHQEELEGQIDEVVGDLREKDIDSDGEELNFTLGGKAPEEDGTWSLDKGGMEMAEILVAWGKGMLDQKRFERLKQRLEFLLDVTLGVV